ncbi:hypothetical protein LSH36_297g03050 [Paralvinella palmiformis]|uniref:P-type domain-containing protein n=1 Tax=Paralvinella palmiformis TaxID=53620 RepID=A0AAD9JHU5_9ANNE|nr:hypothetical protein LSH36_297g03050 [Paralvinella palmiformis]
MNRKGVLILLVGIIILILIVGLGIYYGTRATEYDVPTPEEFARIDCYPEERWAVDGVTRVQCESRGCRYDPFNSDPEQYIPSCYMDTRKGYSVTMDAVPKGERFILKPNPDLPPTEEHFSRVAFEVYYPSVDIIRFKLTDADRRRYEVPDDIVKVNLPDVDIRQFGQIPHYIVNVSEKDPFSFRIIRRETGAVLWDTSVGGLYLSNQYLTVSTKLPSSFIYGFGENSHQHYRHDMNFRTWGLFARDQAVGTGNHNLYGVHPFYMCLEEDSVSSWRPAPE